METSAAKRAKASPTSSGYCSVISAAAGSTWSGQGAKSAASAARNGSGKRRKSEKRRRAKEAEKALARAVLPAKLATFLGVFALITEGLVGDCKTPVRWREANSKISEDETRAGIFAKGATLLAAGACD